MANPLAQTIEQVSREKGIEPRLIQEALEDAMVAAARRFFKTEEDLQSRYDPESGTIEVFAVKKIVEDVENDETEMGLAEALEIDETFVVGEYVEIPKPTIELGRIAAQTAKQVITQKVREAEREIVFEEFSGQVGQVVNGIVRRFEGRDIILDIGRTEAILPLPEQSRNELYKQGDRIRAVIIKVHRLTKGPQIVVSRADPSLLIRLFETEIPEVYDATVVIKNVVREGGERAKVAVASRDETVDPVGACVGMKGSRINAVIRDLKGEKIDIIQYSDDILDYTVNALNPAKIAKVLIMDPVNKVLEVIVPEDQLSLAIGKKGQNVRLASKLLGWEINIKGEEDKKLEILSHMEKLVEASQTSLDKLTGASEKLRERLKGEGIGTVESLLSKTSEELESIPGIGPKTAEKLLKVAREYQQESDSHEDQELQAVSENPPAVSDESSLEELQASAAAQSQGTEPPGELEEVSAEDSATEEEEKNISD
jgi:N utilization substance protein A